MRASWHHFVDRLFSSQGFRGPVLTLLSGASLAMALAYLAQPVLARLYTPEEYGVLDLFVALVAVLITVTSLRYEDALMLPEDDEEAAGVLALSTTLLLAFVVALTLLLPWRRELAALLGLPALAPWLLFLPPTLLFMRSAKLAEHWLTRHRRFRPISSGQVANTATMVGSRLAAGVSPYPVGAGGLIGGYFLGQVVNGLLLGRLVLRRSGRVLVKGFRLPRMRASANRYRRFPLYAMPSALLSSVLGRLPIFLLPWFFDAAVVGLFGMAFKVLAVPLSLVGGAVAQVFFVHAAEAMRADRLAETTRIVHQRLVMLGLYPMLILLLGGPDIFAFVLGDPWREAGVYVQYLGPWFFVAAVASPLTRLFDVLERQRLDLLTNLLMLVVLAVALTAGGLSGDPVIAMLLVSIAGASVRTIQLGVLLHLAEIHLPEAVPAYLRYTLYSVPGLVLTAGARLLGPGWIVTLAAIVGGMIYAAIVLRQDRLLAQR